MSQRIKIVTANSLNVRSGPGTKNTAIGSVTKGNRVLALKEIKNDENKIWWEIEHGQESGYVSGQFLAPLEGFVTASSLQVRSGPSTNTQRVGQLNRGDRVEVLSERGLWYEILYENSSSFVHGDYVTFQDPKPADDFFFEMPTLQTVDLSSESPIDTSNLSTKEKQVAQIWNNYGSLLESLSKVIDIDPACAVAVVCVESGGSGFAADGRMIIRFENHVFYRRWAKNDKNKGIFDRHFTFNQERKWEGHKFSEAGNGEWAAFHSKQSGEWAAFQLAESLGPNAKRDAKLSISMGLPQIMGFNYARIGYENVNDMFDNFSKDARYQILGMFDFIRGPGSTSPMVQALQRFQFEDFAASYNGKGQAAKYSDWLVDRLEVFRNLPRA